MPYKTEEERLWREGIAMYINAMPMASDEVSVLAYDMIVDGYSWEEIQATPEIADEPELYSYLKRRFDAHPEFRDGIRGGAV